MAPSSPSSDAIINLALNRALSLGSQVSSSPAEQHEGSQTFRRIGAGACGAIFAQDGTSLVVKLAKSSDSSELWNDYQKHALIADHFDRFNIVEVKVPDCYFFVPADTNQYFERYPGLIEAAKSVCTLPASALVTERIHPLPHRTRDLLIHKFCAPNIQNTARADAANKDCLVRPYLGSMEGKTGARFFSLRNFKLHLNHILDLQLDAEAIARRMGVALAVMHWAAKTDARDVEFVLGSSREKTRASGYPRRPQTHGAMRYTGPPSFVNENFFCRITELFVLDFNQVRAIKMNDDGIALAVQAWQLNDPYFPKPLRETPVEQNIWKAFAVSYLTASQRVLEGERAGETVWDLPPKFILGITEVERQKMVSRTG